MSGADIQSVAAWPGFFLACVSAQKLRTTALRLENEWSRHRASEVRALLEPQASPEMRLEAGLGVRG